MRSLIETANTWYFKWLVVGIFIRLFLSAITFHPDIWAISFAGKIFTDGGVLNIYEYLNNLPNNSGYLNYGRDFFTYPPLAYFILGFFHFIFSPFLSETFYSSLFVNFSNPFQTNGFLIHMFFIKLPYLLFDIPIAFLLTKFFEDENKKKMAYLLWLLNPVVLYSTYMIGQFDIIPVFFVVLSLYYLSIKKDVLAFLSIGLGGALKFFPLLLLPFSAFSLSKNWKSFKMILIGFTPFLLFSLFFLNSEAFRKLVLFNAQSQKILYAGINISGADTLFLFVIGYIFIAITFIFNRQKNWTSIWKYFLTILLLLFALTNFHPQWFIWIVPLLIIFTVENIKYQWIVYTLIFSYFLIILTFDYSLSLGLFRPIFPNLPASSSILDFLPLQVDKSLARSLIRSIFAGLCLSLVWFNFKKSYEEK